MRLLECGHAAVAGASRVCEHMPGEEPPGFYRVFTGSGLGFDLTCAECVDRPRLTVCEGCVERAERWGDLLGWRGEPGIRHEDRGVPGSMRSEPWAVSPLNEHCLAPLPDGWLALTEAGLVDRTGGLVCRVPLPAEEHDGPDAFAQPAPVLHTSPDGRYAAVVMDNGTKGVVIDLASGAPVLELDRDDPCAYTTPFPIAFLPGGRVIVGTAWNRLDVVDLATGKVLTERETDLDYFHGRLTLSPSGRWLLDDGWVWHPVGVPQVLDVDTWLRDGGDPPAESIAYRAYAWNQPVAWVTPHVVAVQRIGTDDEAMIDGVELYAVPSGRRMEPFAGPVGRMWGHKGLLYVSGTDGLEVWHPERGARIGLVAGFRPIAHRDGTFASLGDGALNSFSVD